MASIENHENGKAEESGTRIVKYRLAGDVQRVGFRHFLEEKAKEYNLAGFASNETDGSLVVLLSGNDETIGKVEPLLYQGPPEARVVAVAELVPEEGDYPPPDKFVIR